MTPMPLCDIWNLSLLNILLNFLERKELIIPLKSSEAPTNPDWLQRFLCMYILKPALQCLHQQGWLSG